MKRALLMGTSMCTLIMMLLGCGDDRVYHNSELLMLTTFRAKMMCSCLFAMEMEESFCKEWSRQSPDVASYKVDVAGQKVFAQSLGTFIATAHFRGPRAGCVLE